MHPAATINILLPRLCDHRKIKHELCPVVALSHLLQRGFAGFKLAVKSGAHHGKMLNTEPFFPRLLMGDLTVWEQRINRLMQRLNFPLINRDSDKPRGNTLCYGCYVVKACFVVGIEVCIQHDVTVPNQQETMDLDVMFPNIIQRLGKFGGVHPLLLWSRRAPASCRPIWGESSLPVVLRDHLASSECDSQEEEYMTNNRFHKVITS